MGILNNMKGGEDLTHPRLSGGWILYAVVGAIVLIGVVLGALFFWGKVSGAAQNIPVVGSMTAPMRVYMS